MADIAQPSTHTFQSLREDSRLWSLAGLLVLAAIVYFFYSIFTKRYESAHADPESTPVDSRRDAIIKFQSMAPPRKYIRPVVPKHTTSIESGDVSAPPEADLETKSPKAVVEKMSLRSIQRSVAGVMGDSGKSDVVKARSNVDNQHYFVAADLPDKTRAADKLAEISRRAQYLLQSVDEQLEGGNKIISGDGHDITLNMRELVRKHFNKRIPMAEYHNPSDLTVGSNSDKGSMIETCLRSKSNPNEWSSDNTLFRVHMHELAHSADFEYRADGEDGHGPHFKRIHQYLLTVAENLGIYSCSEYKSTGGKMCGVYLTEKYCGNGGGPQKE